MAAFFIILQKYYKQTDIFLLDNINDKMNMWKHLYQHTNILNDRVQFCLYYYMTCLYKNKNKNKSKNLSDMIHEKLTFLNTSLSNIFNTERHNDEILNVFSKIQRTYYAFSKLAYIYKMKKAKTQISADLCMNDLSESQSNVFVLYQNKAKYLFTIKDLISIIHTSLSNTHSFIPDPILCKNPYNNIPFTTTDLYNIYFLIKKSAYTMPELFYGYMKSNFDLIQYRNQYETIIINASIKNFVYNSHFHILYPIIMSMLDDYKNITKKIKIHRDFPKNKLVSIFKPYLHLYYTSLYATNGTYSQCTADFILKQKLRVFVNFNPFFGRKYITITKTIENKTVIQNSFNESHVHFYKENQIEKTPIIPIIEDNRYEEQDDDHDGTISAYYETDDDFSFTELIVGQEGELI